MRKIDLMIIGAQKAGTTSLKNYLSNHPKITSHSQVEFSYFRNDSEYSDGFNHAFSNAFHEVNEDQLILAKNVGVSESISALKRLYEHNPDCKLIFVVRDPTDRAYSSYNMGVYQGWEDRPFADITDVIQSKSFEDRFYRFYIKGGLYADHLNEIYSVFKKEQVKVVDFEDLNTDPKKVCSNIFSWIGQDDYQRIDYSIIHNQTKEARSQWIANSLGKIRGKNVLVVRLIKSILPSKYFQKLNVWFWELNKSKAKKEEMDSETRSFLKSFFQKSVEELEHILDTKFNSWK